jgi:hypothetical protein
MFSLHIYYFCTFIPVVNERMVQNSAVISEGLG